MMRGQKNKRRSSVRAKEGKEFKAFEKQDEKVRMSNLLRGKLQISNIEVLIAYDKFFKKYPNGKICKKDFLEESKGNLIAESLFNVFDEDKSGCLDFYEFMMVKNTSSLQTPEEKLSWIFSAFDRDGSGSIDTNEITDIVRGLYKIASKPLVEEDIAASVKEITDAIDVNNDGDISKEEFIENAMKSSFIYKIVTEDADIQ